MSKAQIYIAALAQALTLGGTAEARQAPTAVRILPAGEFAAVDGRPGDKVAGGTWKLTAELARKVIAQVAAQRTDVLVDYEHQSLLSKDNGKPAPAAAWLKALEWRDGPADAGGGLWALDVGWTPAAAAALTASEYRYLSPVFAYDDQGRVTRLVSVALTNTPALDTLDPLVSRAALSLLTGDHTHDTGADMDKDQQIAALTTERDAAKTNIAALTAERDQANTQLAALTAERDGLKAAADQAKADADKKAHADVLQAALTDGRLTPAQKPWAEKQSLAALTEYLDATKPVAALTRQAGDAGAQGEHGLTSDELVMCTRMGVSPEDFVKAKKA